MLITVLDPVEVVVAKVVKEDLEQLEVLAVVVHLGSTFLTREVVVY